MKIRLAKKAVVFLSNLKSKSHYIKIKDAINNIQENPQKGINIKKLSGQKNNIYRKRVGRYRILYTINNQDELIIIWIIEIEKDTKKDYQKWINYITKKAFAQ